MRDIARKSGERGHARHQGVIPGEINAHTGRPILRPHGDCRQCHDRSGRQSDGDGNRDKARQCRSAARKDDCARSGDDKSGHHHQIGPLEPVGEVAADRNEYDQAPAEPTHQRIGLRQTEAVTGKMRRQETDKQDITDIIGRPNKPSDRDQSPFARRQLQFKFAVRRACAVRVAVDESNRDQAGHRRIGGDMHYGLPSQPFCERGEAEQAERDADRPARHQNRHGGGDLAAGKPVGDHLGQQDVHQHRTGVAQHASAGERRERGAHAHERAADDHKREARDHHAFRAEALTEQATRQRNENARQKIKSDQCANGGVIDRKRFDQNRPDRTDGLKLQAHDGARQKQQCEHEPTVLDHAVRPGKRQCRCA